MGQLEGTMVKFKLRMSRQFDILPQVLDPWCSNILVRMRQALHDIGPPSQAHLGPSHAPVYGREERAAMAGILDRYVCTPVDKLANNMCLICRKSLAGCMVDEMQAGVVGADPTYQAVPQSFAQILADAQPVFETYQIGCSDQKLPYYYPMPKLHKAVLAFRFITACSRFYFKNVALWVTRLFRSLELDMHRIWRQLKFPASLGFGRYPPWMIKNSAQLIPMIRRLNMAGSLVTHVVAAPFCRSYDFVQLFTKIPQPLLKDRLSWLLTRVWALQPTKPLVRIRKGMCPKWRRGPMPDIREGRDQGAKYYTFDLQSAIHLISVLIDNAYLVVGDHIFRQVHGIPMGISPAMYMANFFLFTFEFLFFEDALHVLSNATHRLNKSMIVQALKNFQYTARYADDAAFINRQAASELECLFHVN